MKGTFAFLAILAVLILSLSMVSCGGEKAGETGPTSEGKSTSADSGTSANSIVTAREAMHVLSDKASKWSGDSLPVSIGVISRGKSVKDGKGDYWGATFYSPSKKEAYVFNYYQGQATQASKPMFTDVVWQVGDLMGNWNIDSPQAARIAMEKGIEEIVSMDLALRKYSDRNPPQAVPSSCQVYWEIGGKEGKYLFIDATNGEFLGWK